jgi:serine/threonine protein kinase
MASKSDIEHWQIDANVYIDRVVETHFVTDPSRNIRRRPQTVVWHVEKFLGRGGFGEVRLERNRENEKTRAVKKIATSTTLSNKDCERELKALLEFSKPKVSYIMNLTLACS